MGCVVRTNSRADECSTVYHNTILRDLSIVSSSLPNDKGVQLAALLSNLDCSLRALHELKYKFSQQGSVWKKLIAINGISTNASKEAIFRRVMWLFKECVICDLQSFVDGYSNTFLPVSDKLQYLEKCMNQDPQILMLRMSESVEKFEKGLFLYDRDSSHSSTFLFAKDGNDEKRYDNAWRLVSEDNYLDQCPYRQKLFNEIINMRAKVKEFEALTVFVRGLLELPVKRTDSGTVSSLQLLRKAVPNFGKWGSFLKTNHRHWLWLI